MGINYENDPTGGSTSASNPIPEGEYVLTMVKHEEKESNTKPGNFYLNAEFVVKDGEHADRRLWVMYNLKNSSQSAQNIGWANFNSLKAACGTLSPNPDDLVGVPFRGKIFVTKDTGYGEGNGIRKYMPLNGGDGGSSSGGSGGSAGGEPKKKRSWD